MVEATVRGILLASWTAILLVLIVTYHLLWRRKRSTNSNFPPGLKCNSLMLYIMLYRNITADAKKTTFFCAILQYLCAFSKLFKSAGIFGFWVFNKYFVIVLKPETVEVVLKNSSHLDKSKEYRYLEPWLGKGLLTSEREEWRLRRKLVMPSFNARLLDDFLPVVDEQSRVLVSKLQASTDQPWVDVVPLLKMCTLDVICQTAMGVPVNEETGECFEYVKAVSELVALAIQRVIKPWFWLDAIFYSLPSGRKYKRNLNLLHAFTRKVIREKKLVMLAKDSEKTKEDDCSHSILKKPRPCLELLLENHLADSSFTEENVREEVDTLMSAGYHTTAMGLSWTLYLLGLHPEVQVKCMKEIDSVFGGDAARPVTREDLNHMTYLECVIKEAYRLYPPVPLIIREIKEDAKFLEYHVPPGSSCIINIYSLHRDPHSFENPESFEPERFLPENSPGKHPYAYIPFSAGPRNCIGQRFSKMVEKVVLATILRHFRVESLDKRDTVNVEPGIVLSNMDPIRIRFVPRPRIVDDRRLPQLSIVASVPTNAIDDSNQ